MKCLTIKQPYAWAIMQPGGKTIENRSQAWKYRGPLAIHAGSSWSARGFVEVAGLLDEAWEMPSDRRGGEGANGRREMTQRFWHGGAPGLRAGDLIAPRPGGDEQHLVDGCPTCEARRRGEQLAADDNDPSLIYVTTDREYARIYASGYPRGALYVVEPVGELVDRSAHDPVPSWGCPAARVLSVYDPLVVLSAKQARRLRRRYVGVAS